MANWAQVGYRIEGKQKDLQEIYELFGEFDKGERKRNYSAPPMGMSNRLTVVLQQELH